MDWPNSPELLDVFRDEVRERGQSLVAGARALTDLSPIQLTDLRRDAHTVKGSARMLSYSAVASAAELMEEVWGELAKGMLQADSALGSALAALAAELEPALGAGPVADPENLREAVRALHAALGKSNLPESPGWSEEASLPDDLGGLLSSLADAGVGQSMRVEGSRVYQLINQAAEIKLEAGLLTEQARRLEGASAQAIDAFVSDLAAFEAAVGELRDSALRVTAVPASDMTSGLNQLAEYLGRRTGKELRLDVKTEDVDVDRLVVDALREPLRRLVVNAIDHGLETHEERVAAGKQTVGVVKVSVLDGEGYLEIRVEDDGRGVDWDRVRAEAEARQGGDGTESQDGDLTPVLFESDFTPAASQRDLSGGGEGMAAALAAIRSLHGSLNVESEPGLGTAIVMRVPTMLALQDVLFIKAGGQKWGIPKAAVLESGSSTSLAANGDSGTRGQGGMPVWSFGDLVGLPTEEAEGIIVLSTPTGPVGLAVSEVCGERQVAVKELGPLLAGVPFLNGAAVLGGNEVVPIVEPAELLHGAQRDLRAARPRILVVDDSPGVRRLVAAALTGDGFLVVLAPDAEAALELLAAGSFDGLVADYQLPGSDGIHLVGEVRRVAPSLPIVMVSAVATTEDQARARAAGVDAYLNRADLREGGLASALRELIQVAALEGSG